MNNISICATCFPKGKGTPASGRAMIRRNFQAGDWTNAPSHGICPRHLAEALLTLRTPAFTGPAAIGRR